MTTKELLDGYRAALLELDELEAQLARVGTDGRPAGCRGAVTEGHLPGTNDPAAAAAQLAEGLETLACRKREELAKMAEPIRLLMGGITNVRTFTIVQRYYLMAETDAQIGSLMNISRVRVCQIRKAFLAAA